MPCPEGNSTNHVEFRQYLETLMVREGRTRMTLWERWQQGGRLQLAFQPIVSLTGLRVLGYEVLSRPYDYEGNLMAVEPFFDAAAASGHALTMDQQVLAALSRFVLNNALSVPIFWNAHPASIAGGILSKIRQQFAIHQIVVEITEKGEWPDAIIPMIASHQAEGYTIALDDFGAGYSGLRRLIQMRPNVVKVDRDIVQNLDQDRIKQQLVEAVVHLAPSVGFKVLAEGLETLEEIQTCMSLGVNWGQGYYFAEPATWESQPVPEREVLETLLVVRAQSILADQRGTAFSVEARWQALTRLLEVVEGLALPQAVPVILQMTESASCAIWQLAIFHEGSWHWWAQDYWEDESLGTAIIDRWIEEREGRGDWIVQDAPEDTEKWLDARSVALWPIGDPVTAVLIAWYPIPNQWSPARVEWGNAVRQVIGLFLRGAAK